MSRRKGRVLAFQALYSWDVGGIPKDSLMSFSWAEAQGKSGIDENTKTFAAFIIAGTLEHIEEIDKHIKANLSKNWDFSRLDRVALAILRMSVYSLLFQNDIPPTIVMDEAVGIAKEFGSDDSYKFINAMLDSVSKNPRSVKES